MVSRSDCILCFLLTYAHPHSHRNAPCTPVKWAKWGHDIILEGPRELTACNNTNRWQLVTTNIEDGAKTGYFEVELTQGSFVQVGMFWPGLDHSKNYGCRAGDGWVLRTSTGSYCDYTRGTVGDRLGWLKVGDRVGVLVDLEEKEGREGGSILFFVNGVKFGSGFTSGMAGPLVLGVEMLCADQKVTLLPDAQRPAGF